MAGTALVFRLRERIARLPITSFGGITENFWLQAGGVDFNWLGRGATLGAFYQYYDRHSFKVFVQFPYLFGNRWGFSTTQGQQATLEPAYIGSQTIDVNVDRWESSLMLRHEVARNYERQSQMYVEAGGGYLKETYMPLTVLPELGIRRFHKYYVQATFAQERLNYYGERISGVTNTFFVQNVRTVDQDLPFWKMTHVFRAYGRLGARGNPAMRIRMGLSKNEDSPFVPFVLDSYLNVRGSGNRVARGTSELTFNLEHRHTLRRFSWGALQGIVFTDVSAWRSGGDPFFGMFDRENVVSFAGVGGRLHWWRVYNFILRLDYGFSLTRAGERGFVLGVGQYF